MVVPNVRIGVRWRRNSIGSYGPRPFSVSSPIFSNSIRGLTSGAFFCFQYHHRSKTVQSGAGHTFLYWKCVRIFAKIYPYMVINYFGNGCFRLQSGETSVLVNPENNRLKADVTLKTLTATEVDASAEPTDEIVILSPANTKKKKSRYWVSRLRRNPRISF